MTAFANLPMSSSDSANQRLEDVMEEMADGQVSAIMPFWQEFSSKMCRTLRGILRELDQRDLAADAEYVRDLAFESCWVIYDRAPRWNSEDEPPWQWARLLLVGWVQDWLEQTGEVEPSEAVELPGLGLLNEWSHEYEGDTDGDTDSDTDSSPASDTASDINSDTASGTSSGTDRDSDLFETDTQASTDTFMTEFAAAEESRSMSDRFDEALGLRPKN